MMCGEGNKQQEQMTSEAAKSLVSIANALTRMEKGRNKRKTCRKYKAEKCLEKMSSAVSTPAPAAPKRGCGSLNIYLTLSSQVFFIP